ncbi:MAG: hypothetical protein HY898_31220 [Deltaproteobacteria bacterium]|nr:hypothetical protein [Deltaproteobacteria bacterium]
MRTSWCVRSLVWIACVAMVSCKPSSTAPSLVRALNPASDAPITQSGVKADDGGWRIDPSAAGSVRLFEIPGDTCEECRLIYRAKLRTDDIKAPAYLEMWVRLPGKGEFFSRGLAAPVQGTTGWASYEIPFFFKKGEKADLVKLNVGFQAPGGALWIKDVELMKGAL